MEAFEFIQNNWAGIMTGLTSIVGGFSIIATITPNQADNKIVDYLARIVNFLGANIGKSKNA